MADLKQIDYNGTTYNIGGGTSKYRHNFEIVLSGFPSNKYEGSFSFSVINSNPPTYYSSVLTLDKIKATISGAFVHASGLVFEEDTYDDKYLHIVTAVQWSGTQFVLRYSSFWVLNSVDFHLSGSGDLKLPSDTEVSYKWLSSETIIS